MGSRIGGSKGEVVFGGDGFVVGVKDGLVLDQADSLQTLEQMLQCGSADRLDDPVNRPGIVADCYAGPDSDTAALPCMRYDLGDDRVKAGCTDSLDKRCSHNCRFEKYLRKYMRLSVGRPVEIEPAVLP